MNIFWDIQNQKFITSLTNSAQISRWDWVLRDQVEVNLYVVQPDPTTGSYVQQEAPAGFAPKFGIRVTRESVTPVDPLVFAGTWVLSGSGTSAKYIGTINLGDAALIAAIGISPYLDVWCEAVMRDISGTDTSSTQTEARIYFDVIRGGATETTWVPPFPWVSEFTDPATGKKCLRFKNSDGETLETMSPTGV